MKATRDHISLETAKLLKDCKVCSENIWVEECIDGDIFYYLSKKENFISYKGESGYRREMLKVYSWREILWEYTKEFFGKKMISRYNLINILTLLQKKKYDEADLYFRENCILISKE